MLPEHIVIIPDGNRRWATAHSKTIVEGYQAGIAKIIDALTWCGELNLKILTFWGFSTENFFRNKNEVNNLLHLFNTKLDEALREDTFKKYDIRVRILGKLSLMPTEIRHKIRTLEKITEKHKKHSLNILFAYGGRQEIVDACNAILREYRRGRIKRVTEEIFASHLYTNGLPYPDLIIRTSGEQRLSGLMPWQSAYSELYFSKKLWPDFTKADLIKALNEYSRRQRRFGH
ncbi:MAG: polyprenyl diphosphate synthase [Candidatus Micrarchaeia archaeon]